MSSCSDNSHMSLKKKGEVVSKYFNDGKSSMDESISDFQEPKKSCRGPKAAKLTQKPLTTNKTKNKQGNKKIKGQKDIRSVLKSNKNELETYAQDFDKVCKQSGIDVDSEQLQLAIALSKSLQDTPNTEQNGSQNSVPLSIQERTGKIRTTLQEYGFKVPEVKIEIGKRKLRGRKKSSKLLLITEAERRQTITDRYSQVLRQNVNDAKVVNKTCEHQKKDTPLYDIVSNKSYEYLKGNEIFYVKNLIEISSHSIGTLLRDWSEIPGRPLSPVKQKPDDLKFIDLDFANHEIDIMLSGPLEKVQEIINSKRELTKHELSKIEAKDSKIPNMEEVVIEVPEDSNSPNMETAASISDMALLAPTQFPRCASPDLFDDDLSSVVDNIREKDDVCQKYQLSPQNNFLCASQPFSQNLTSNRTRKISNDFMELTECVSVQSQCSSSKTKDSKTIATLNVVQTIGASTSQKYHTKRKSDDFMEITDCVETCEQFKSAVVEDNIDLTQESEHDEAEDAIIVEEVNTAVKRIDNVEKLDLTQSSNSNDETLPFVQISGQKPNVGDVMETIDISDKGTSNKELTDTHNFQPDIDKLHSPMKERESKSSKESSVFEEYLFEHSDHSTKENDFQLTESEKHVVKIKDDAIDLTQNSDISEEIPICNSIHLIEGEKNCLGKKDDISIDYDEMCTTESKNEELFQNQRKYIELKTQKTTDLSIIDQNRSYENNTMVLNIDHEDEDKIIDKSHHANNSELEQFINRKSSLSDPTSQVFEISDDELNYSMHKSKHLADNSHESNEISYEISKDNFVFDGISIMDNLSTNVDKSKSIYHDRVSSITLNKSASDSFLPVVEIKGTKVKMKSPEKVGTSTPIKDLIKEKFAPVETPNHSEYVIKTQEVTPIMDYGAMSTPDRNRELEKYGLKPFKRKRAIQLLTHLYNQTHPVIEKFTSEDHSSPSKRPKTDTEPPQLPTSPKKSVTKSPRKLLGTSPKKTSGKSPRKGHAKSSKDKDEAGTSNLDIDKENSVMYEETQAPAIKDIECLPEDWVFQKREKAKVHSCKVPLHITFHNYVSSRRGVREAILRYSPVDISLVHRHLAATGHRYDPKDLLRFLDKKCITVKTADNNGRNNKRCQRKS